MSNHYQLLVGASDFMAALRADASRCHTRLFAQFMTYEADSAGYAFSGILRQRAEAGADVRLLVDWYSDHILSDIYPTAWDQRAAWLAERTATRELFATLNAEGVAVRRTAPFGPLRVFSMYRNHKKLVVLDDQIAYIGGINIADHNFGWHDFMVRVEGPIVADLLHDFQAEWDGTPVVFDTPHPGQDYVLNQAVGRSTVYDALLRQIATAQESIKIEVPYLLGERIEAALVAAARRGVRITLIVPAVLNKVIFQRWNAATYRRLNHPNIRLYGYQSHGGMTHAKLYIIDDTWTMIGSLNTFELECITHQELNIVSQNAELIAQLDAQFQADLQQSSRMAPPRRDAFRLTHTLLYYVLQVLNHTLIHIPAWRRQYGHAND
jgi:cardiolipin synthase A/B